jgi:hypothetical protein
MIKTFRGLIADGGQDTIVLHTNNGSTGYRVTKFQIFPNKPGLADYESVVKIYKIQQTTIPTASAEVDFNDQTLLAVSYLVGTGTSSSDHTIEQLHTIFDNEIINQDIYITHTANTGSDACNYYIELEQVKLDLNQNTVATLKDIRNVTAP